MVGRRQMGGRRRWTLLRPFRALSARRLEHAPACVLFPPTSIRAVEGDSVQIGRDARIVLRRPLPGLSDRGW